MPNISNATVATGTGLSTASNGGRKLVRLSNGWLVAVVKNGTTDIRFHVSKDNGTTWSQLCLLTDAVNIDVSIQAIGTKLHILTNRGTDLIRHRVIDVTTQTNTDLNLIVFTNVDSGQSSIGNLSLAINESGTELHAAWSSKNATYPNSFNIRYAKGTINGDDSVTWGAVEQRTTASVSGYFEQNPTIGIANGKPYIVREAYNGTNYSIQALQFDGTTWNNRIVYAGSTYPQSSPSAIFVPQSVNGLANGRIWVAWHGKDATDSAKFNVRVSYSDDGGVTWATPVKLTSGNLYDRQNVSLAADKTGKVFALYEEHQWSPDLDIYMRTFSGGSWGAPVAVAEADPAAESNPSALVDYSLQMTTPPFVFMSGTDGIKFSGNFNVGASVSPASGALGSKETPTITAYTVTQENGSTVTQIVEKLNGVTLNTYNNPASLSRTFTVPQVNWDGIPFWYSHTAEITVTDSNGAVTTTTYTFVKGLADNAPTLEGVAATEDAYERISDKRDALAAQVGLSAGSTFDAISVQLASGAFAKVQGGTISSSSGTFSFSYASSGTVPLFKLQFNGLSFKPKIILLVAQGANRNFTLFTEITDGFGQNNVKVVTSYNETNLSAAIYNLKTGVANSEITNTGFSLPVWSASTNYTWLALG